MPTNHTHELSPLPPVAFRVGVTGHRPNRLDAALLPDLGKTIGEVLACARRTVLAIPGLRADAPCPTLRLITSLAEGSDRLAAHAARNLGFELQVPLPFRQQEYERDFTLPGSTEEFRGLLAEANSVFRLNADPLARDLGYRAAGEVVLMQSDLLIAVWDGHAAHGVGGTGELVERAQLIGLPVIHIDSETPSQLRFLAGDGAHAEALVALESFIRSLFITTGESPLHCGVGTAYEVSAPKVRSRWPRWIANLIPPADTTVGYAVDYVRAKWPRRIDPTAYTLLRLFTEGQLRYPSPKESTRDVQEIENESLRPYFLWTDTLAMRYGEFSRGASLRIQAWAALAFISCLLAIPLASDPSMLRLLSCVELTSTLAVLIEAYVAWRFRWHNRWMLFRSIAEQIRCLDLLAPVALGIPRLHGFLARDWASGEGFAAYFAQSLARGLGVPSVEVDAAYLHKQTHHLLKAIKMQRAFHDVCSRRYEKIEHFLTRGGIFVFVLVFGVCAFDFLEVFHLTHSHHWLTICAALLLSAGSTIAALAAQGEFKRLAKRSDSMRRALNMLDRRLQVAPPTSLRTLTVAATEVSEVLISEVRDWEALLSTRPPSVNI